MWKLLIYIYFLYLLVATKRPLDKGHHINIPIKKQKWGGIHEGPSLRIEKLTPILGMKAHYFAIWKTSHIYINMDFFRMLNFVTAITTACKTERCVIQSPPWKFFVFPIHVCLSWLAFLTKTLVGSPSILPW